VESFTTVWDVSLILFAIHVGLIGYLAVRSRQIPTMVGILLMFAGFGYLIDGFGTVLVPDYDATVAQFSFFGEVVLTAWLLVKGSRMTVIQGEGRSA
jgi:Domain of unknown function (DUF4386)